MRFRLGIAFGLLFLAALPLTHVAAQEHGKGAFKVERQDLDRLQAERVNHSEAVRWIVWLIVLPIAAFIIIMFFKHGGLNQR